jgi:hypothetical protein
MQARHPGHDLIETALTELESAEKAGLFRATPVQEARLLTPVQSTAAPWARLWNIRLWGPLAAAAVIAVSVWGWMFQRELVSIRHQASGVSMELRLASSDLGRFADCFAGPGKSVASPCSVFDADSDGDVDLADYSARQGADRARAQ